jgi:SAM-dependent methyltransferase
MQLYVGGLADDTAEADVKEVFSGICPPRLVTIIRDIESGKSRGFAIVKITGEEKGEEAIRRLNGTVLRGKNIVVRRMPETLPGEMEFREWLVEHACQVLIHIGVSQAQTVLDYGCGPGIFTIPSARIVGQRGRVYAFEARASLLERVREKAKEEALSNIVAVLSESSRPTIDLPDDSVDIVLVYDVMHEIKDRPGLLRELHRVLKRDGILSVFPMHMGTENFINIIREYGLFSLRNQYGPPGFKAASEILNFNKCRETP